MIEIGYWNIRGLVGGIRVLLEHVGEEWKETQYEAHFRDGQWDRSEWQNVKKSDEVQSKFAFPNIPWMKDGDVCLSQSTAILKYIARKHKVGTNLSETEAWRVDQGSDQICDVRAGFVGMCYGRSTPFGQREAYCNNNLKPQLKQLNSYMDGNRFVAGETLTYVDFMFWEILDHMTRFGEFCIHLMETTRLSVRKLTKDSTLFDGLDHLKAFKSNFESLPKVNAYINSANFMRGPCNNKMAKWGGDAELKRTW